jgi:hypothetical protein
MRFTWPAWSWPTQRLNCLNALHKSQTYAARNSAIIIPTADLRALCEQAAAKGYNTARSEYWSKTLPGELQVS